jgi:hypothetical protein
VLQAGLRHEEGGVDVDGEGVKQLLGRDVADAVVQVLHTRIVDQDVDAAERVQRLLHGVLCELGQRGVAGQRDGVRALSRHHLHHLLGILRAARPDSAGVRKAVRRRATRLVLVEVLQAA